MPSLASKGHNFIGFLIWVKLVFLYGALCIFITILLHFKLDLLRYIICDEFKKIRGYF